MGDDDTQHWQDVYQRKSELEVSWFEPVPRLSLELIHRSAPGHAAAIIDVGGGASRLVDCLLREGYCDVTVLDIAGSALDIGQRRLGSGQADVSWLRADVRGWRPTRSYDVWHDRAAFHFLVEPADQQAYARTLSEALKVGGIAIIGTFAPDGPERCSGLPVQRHDAASILAVLGDSFELLESVRHSHRTPAGAVQLFQFSRFRRLA